MILTREQGDAAFLTGYLDGLACWRNRTLDEEDGQRLRDAARMLALGYDLPHLFTDDDDNGTTDHDGGEG